MNKRVRKLFQDDFSVNKQPYFLSLLYVIILSSILYFSLKLSDYVTEEKIYGVVAGLFSLVLCFLGLCLAKKVGFNLINIKYFRSNDLVYVLGGLFVIKSLDLLFTFFQLEPSANDQAIQVTFSGTPAWLLIISLAIIPAFVEEYIFRGFILRIVFRNHLFLGVLISSILFSLFHPVDNFIDYIPYFYSGIIFCFIYLKTKIIETSIIIHFLNNLGSTLLIIFNT